MERNSNIINRIFDNHIVFQVTMCLFFCFSVSFHAEGQIAYGFDNFSVDAYVRNHKKVRTVLVARSIVEQGNQILHESSSKEAVEYKDVNTKLDRYTKCFDVIDVVLSAGGTAANVYVTITDVKNRLNDYKSLVETYRDKCLKRGNIVSSDSVIFFVSERAINMVSVEVEDMYNSMIDLAGYASGTVNCTTEKLLTVLDAINTNLDNIRHIVDNAYFTLWRYITIRTHYWKADLYQAKSIKQMAEEALERWLESSKGIDY